MVCSGIVFRHVLHFLSSSILSRTRNAVILRIRDRGNGFSSGNWIDPLAVANFERSFAKAFTAVQEPSLAAAMQWPSEGLPDNPRRWLTQVTFRRMADHIRSESARRRRESEVAQVAQVAAHTTESTVIETAPQED